MQSYNEYRRESPSEYYLYIPEEHSDLYAWKLFIGLHGEGESGKDCFRTWQPLAEQYGFILLCPTFVEVDGRLAETEGEVILANILRVLYQEVDLDGRFFLAGYAAGADFALGYAYRYPGAVSAISVISATRYPAALSNGGDLPTLVLLGENDREYLEPAQAFVDALTARSYPARLLVLKGADRRLSSDAVRLTAEFFKQVTR